jgi:FAD/FMN-containing dehydrogenase
MEGFVEKVTRILREHWREKGRVLVFGHLGDGNLHVIVTVGEDSPEIRHRVESLVYAALKEAHGSVSAEHGIGLEKKSYLELCRNAGELALMRLLKRTLDPTDMFNPGKLL